MESGRAASKSEPTTRAPHAPDAERRHAQSRTNMLTRLRERFEFGDALLFVFVLAFARQYLWPLESNALAWILASALATAALHLYVRTKPFAMEGAGREFWILVALPLFFI